MQEKLNFGRRYWENKRLEERRMKKEEYRKGETGGVWRLEKFWKKKDKRKTFKQGKGRR